MGGLTEGFKVIPAIDLMQGVVVHGVAGKRKQYQEIKSKLASSAGLFQVIKGMVEQLGVWEFYLADLDALMSGGRENQLDLIADIKNYPFENLTLMVDAGVTDEFMVKKILKTGVDKVILGTETLPSLEKLDEIVKIFGSKSLVLSIDTKGGKIISPSAEISQMLPEEMMLLAGQRGIREIILLELQKVGTGQGINKSLIQSCVKELGSVNVPINLYIGGGISDFSDLIWLEQKNVQGALVASILHQGLINEKMLKELIINTAE